MASSFRQSYARAFLGGRKQSSSSSIYGLAMRMLIFLSFLVLILLAFRIYNLPIRSGGSPADAEFPPQHRTELPGPRTRSLRDLRDLGQQGKKRTEIISWEPRAFIYHNFLSKEECEYLIELAKPHMKKSEVVYPETGQGIDSRDRTSSGTFLERGQDMIIRTIEKRIADYTFIPVENGEGLQVLHYEAGQEYKPHYDTFFDKLSTYFGNGGHRMATLLMYLSDVEEGGETIFPSARLNTSSSPRYSELSECGKRGLAVKPKMGDALLFYSMKPDATLDSSSLHGGCPVIKGNKWCGTKWMHLNEYKYL